MKYVKYGHGKWILAGIPFDIHGLKLIEDCLIEDCLSKVLMQSLEKK